MNENMKDLSPKVIAMRRQQAEELGFWLAPEKPGYDLIGSRARAALIERKTEELVVMSAKIIERNGRPWIKTFYPKNRDFQEYVFLGWAPERREGNGSNA